jgi:hypothetical protein
LTGTQVLLLVASETGHVYTFATPKLQPLITKPEGKNLIQSCLNAPEVAPVAPQPQHHQPRIQNYNEPAIMYPTSELSRDPPLDAVGYDEDKKVHVCTCFLVHNIVLTPLLLGGKGLSIDGNGHELRVCWCIPSPEPSPLLHAHGWWLRDVTRIHAFTPIRTSRSFTVSSFTHTIHFKLLIECCL